MNSERTSPGTIASTTSLSISSSGSCDDNDETAHFYPNPHDNNSLRLLQLIPVTLFSEILAYLSLSEGRYLCQTCHYLWNISSTLESHRCCIDITKTSVTTTNTGNQPQHEIRCLMYPPICSNWNNVRVLHLSNFATDKILFTLQNQLPNLQELYMNGSGGGESSSDGDLTDFGLLSLMMTENPSHSPTIGFVIDRIRTAHLDVARCRNLRYIDVTECSGTSYYATIILRNKLQHPDLIIRRIPKWIEGHFLRNQKMGYLLPLVPSTRMDHFYMIKSPVTVVIFAIYGNGHHNRHSHPLLLVPTTRISNLLQLMNTKRTEHLHVTLT